MRVYKQQYTNKKGKTKKSKKWYVRIQDHTKTKRAFPAFTNKEQSVKLGEKIEKLVVCRMNNEPPDRELSTWLTQIPSKLRERFSKIGLIDPQRAACGKTLIEHLGDFESSLRAKGTSEKHVSQTISRIDKVLKACNFKNWNDISADLVQREIPKIRKFVDKKVTKKVNGKKVKTKKRKDLGVISAKTANYYLKAFKQFCKWMVVNRRASESPVEYLQPIKNPAVKRKRRALEPDELKLLIKTAKSEPDKFGMTGDQRAMLYQLAVETGLRANELRSLKKSSFDFENLSLFIDGGYTKNKKSAVLPLKKDTANELQSFLSEKEDQETAFNVPDKTAEMIKNDLEAAGLSYKDQQGRYADFHALRHTTGSWLAANGVHPKVAQVILRHSDINLTMSRYTHIFKGQESEAIAKLPNLSGKVSKTDKKSEGKESADGKSLPPGLPPKDELWRTSTNLNELEGKDTENKKTPFSAQNQRFQAKNEVKIKRGRRESNAQPSDRQADLRFCKYLSIND